MPASTHDGLSARQWWNRLNEYNPHVAKRYVKERPHLTAKQIAGLQNTGKLIGKVNTPKTNGKWKCTNGKCTKPTKAKATTKATKAKATPTSVRQSHAKLHKALLELISKFNEEDEEDEEDEEEDEEDEEESDEE